MGCRLKNIGQCVVGGANTEVNEYQWMVALFEKGKTLPFCGGTQGSSDSESSQIPNTF